jgi:hypothetical protein
MDEPLPPPEPETPVTQEVFPAGVAPPTGQELLYPAFMAAICAGVLSGVPVLNTGCCLWMSGGGVLAVYFFELKTGRPLTRLGDGARLGTITGFFGFFVAFFVNLFSQILIYRGISGVLERYHEEIARMPVSPDPQSKEMLAWALTPAGMAGLFITGTILFFLFFVTLSTAGGAVGVKALRKEE